jgi:hypothetical protein
MESPILWTLTFQQVLNQSLHRIVASSALVEVKKSQENAARHSNERLSASRENDAKRVKLIVTTCRACNPKTRRQGIVLLKK